MEFFIGPDKVTHGYATGMSEKCACPKQRGHLVKFIILNSVYDEMFLLLISMLLAGG